VGSVPVELCEKLQEELALTRAVETGTFEGDGARTLSRLFPQVVSVELSDTNFERARRTLRRFRNIELILGDSRQALPTLPSPDVPTLYFLDGHWSEGPAGQDAQCPVMDELAALRGGHPNDCVIIDDAQFFLAAPPPPYNPSHWPRLVELIDAIRAVYPSHHITLLHDQVIAVPVSAARVVDAIGMRAAQSRLGAVRRKLIGDVLGPLSPTRRALRRGMRIARDVERKRRSTTSSTSA